MWTVSEEASFGSGIHPFPRTHPNPFSPFLLGNHDLTYVETVEARETGQSLREPLTWCLGFDAGSAAENAFRAYIAMHHVIYGLVFEPQITGMRRRGNSWPNPRCL